MSKKNEKTLVLCVDRDDDLGLKAGVETPIIGRANNLEAASKLALSDPEESDANAIFGAVQTYDSLSLELTTEQREIATIAGSKQGGVTADKKISNQLLEILEHFRPKSVILVTDGFSDEQVIPIIQSQVPIMSVKRVVVRHSESIEESWVVLSRYVRKAFRDPYYSRWLLGTPGILLVLMSIIWQFVEVIHPGVVLLVLLGVILIIKGFSIDRLIVEFIYPNPPNLIRLFTTATSLIIGGLAFYQTYGILLENVGGPQNWINILPLVLGYVFKYAVDLLAVAFSIFIIGLGVYRYFMRDSAMLWSIVGLVVAICMRAFCLKVSEILLLGTTPVPTSYWIELSTIIALSVIATVVVIFIMLRLGKRLDVYFKKEVQ